MAVTLLPACHWTEGAFAIYTANVHTHTKVVLRGAINSKETLSLKPLSAQCMSNLAR